MNNVNSRIRDYVNSLEADNKALRNELEALKAEIASNECIHSFHYFGSAKFRRCNLCDVREDVIIHANKLEAGK